MRKSYSAKFKSEVSIEAIKSEKTMAENYQQSLKSTGIKYKNGRKK